jgi:hypothetical protein
LSRVFLDISRTRKNAMKLKSVATVAFILIPSLACAAGGTGVSNAGKGSPSGANSDASNGNTPVGPANSASDRAGKSGNSGSMGASGTGDTDVPATMGASKEMKRQSVEPQKAP